MQLFLARHGNTFRKGQSVVWVGSQNDLPLVESGIEQARQLGKAFAIAKVKPSAVYTGPLQRMTEYAAIILNEMGLPLKPIVESQLNEIDYGKWSGLTTQEVCDKFGIEEFEAWEKNSQWPQKGEWGESAEMLTKRIQDFAKDLVKAHADNETILIVASNGCLRYFLDLIPGQLQNHIDTKTIKIATGNICKLTYDVNQAWKLDFWNMPANTLTQENYFEKETKLI